MREHTAIPTPAIPTPVIPTPVLAAHFSQLHALPPPKWGANTTPWGGANTPVFDIDFKNPGIALQANSLRGDVCAL